MNRKYELLPSGTFGNNVNLYRIRAIRDFSDVKAGDLGGYVKSENNLSHEGNCWIYNSAIVKNGARVINDAKISNYAIVSNGSVVRDNAQVSGSAKIYFSSEICGMAHVYDNARVVTSFIMGESQIYGNSEINRSDVLYNACICGNAKLMCSRVSKDAFIKSNSDFYTQGPIGSRNDYITFYKNDEGEIMVCVGCFNDTLKEFLSEVGKTHGDNKYAKQYLLIASQIEELFKLKE